MKSIWQRFTEFDYQNPHIYRALREQSEDLRKRGIRKVGISLLYERLRWMSMIDTGDPNSEFKLCNDYRACYARKLMQENPNLDGMFETRMQRAY